MKTTLSNPTFDTRTVRKKLSNQEIAQKDYETYLKTLPDELENMEEVICTEEQPIKSSEGKSKAPSAAPTFSEINEIS